MEGLALDHGFASGCSESESQPCNSKESTPSPAEQMLSTPSSWSFSTVVAEYPHHLEGYVMRPRCTPRVGGVDIKLQLLFTMSYVGSPFVDVVSPPFRH